MSLNPLPKCRRRDRAVMGWCVVLALVVLPAAIAAAQGPAAVRVEPVVEKQVQAKARINGTLRAVQQSSVATQEAGRVEQVLVDEGDTVTAGAVIARLDRRRMEAELAEREAELATAESALAESEANRDLASSEFERMRQAFETRASSADEFNEAKFALAAAEARVAASERAITRVERAIDAVNVRIADLEVLAPYDGIVIERSVDPGEWLSAGDAVLTMVSTGPIEVWLDVPERYAGFDMGGEDVSFPIEVQGVGVLDSQRVRRVAQVDPRARTFRVIATVADQGGRLTPGMSATAFVPTGSEQQALCIPADAVLRDGGGAFVYRVAERGEQPIAEMVPVRVMFDADGMLAVESGQLRAGDQLVVEGNERLMPGQPIAPSTGGDDE